MPSHPSVSPLDTLFRRTVGDSAATAEAPAPAKDTVASAAPVRTTGTRTRAGNAMNRTRAALLKGAAKAVAATGTRFAMAQVATLAGVAKATLYNHFRTRDAVIAALTLDQVQQLIDRYRELPLTSALTGAADSISRNDVVRGLARVEPAALAALASIDEDQPAWQLARRAVAEVLDASGRSGADTVLRWLGSYLLNPATPEAIARDAEVLIAGLPTAARPPVAEQTTRSA